MASSEQDKESKEEGNIAGETFNDFLNDSPAFSDLFDAFSAVASSIFTTNNLQQ